MSNWRNQYKVHPAADVFPMMADDELAELQANIRANGVKLSIVFWHDGRLLDGRNRLEAMERLGIDTDRASIHADTVTCGDPAAWVITLNIHRRHLTKQQRADLIVKALEASRQNGESDAHTKARAVEIGKQCSVGKRTVERSLAEVERRPKKSRQPKLETYVSPEIDDTEDDTDNQTWLLSAAGAAKGLPPRHNSVLIGHGTRSPRRWCLLRAMPVRRG